MKLDRSNAADERRRNERIAKVLEFDKYRSGEEFTAREIADLICQCNTDNAPSGVCGCPSRARDLLDYMPDIIKRSTSKCALYSRKPPSMATLWVPPDQKHMAEVHEIHANTNLERLIGEIGEAFG